MAEFLEVSSARYREVLTRLLGVDEMRLSLAPEIMPVLALTGDLDPELRALMTDYNIAGVDRVGASALNFTHIQIRNPADSGVIDVISIAVSSDNATTIQIGTTDGAALAGFAAGSGLIRYADLRLRTRVPAITNSIRNNNAAQQFGDGETFSWSVPATGETQELPVTWVLGPNSGIVVVPIAVNQNLRVSFWGRERGARREELTLG